MGQGYSHCLDRMSKAGFSIDGHFLRTLFVITLLLVLRGMMAPRTLVMLEGEECLVDYVIF